MEVITVAGSEYETGVQVGRLFADEMKKCAGIGREKLADAAIARDFAAVRPLLEKDYAGSLEHLAGRAAGAGVDPEAYLLFVCSDVYEDRCTDIMVKTPSGALLGHNEDGEYTTGNCALIRYEVDGSVFYDFSAPDCLPGGSFSFNRHGLVFTMNYMHMEKRDNTGVPAWFVLRQAVEAKDTDDLLRILSGRSFGGGFNMNAVDYRTGRILTIEGKNGELDVIDVADRFVHSNHYIHEAFEEYYSYDESNTLYRLAKARELLGRIQGTPTLEDIKDILFYHNDNYYNSILETKEMSDSLTACTFLYNGETKHITIHHHLTGTVLELDLKALVES